MERPVSFALSKPHQVSRHSFLSFLVSLLLVISGCSRSSSPKSPADKSELDRTESKETANSKGNSTSGQKGPSTFDPDLAKKDDPDSEPTDEHPQENDSQPTKTVSSGEKAELLDRPKYLEPKSINDKITNVFVLGLDPLHRSDIVLAPIITRTQLTLEQLKQADQLVSSFDHEFEKLSNKRVSLYANETDEQKLYAQLAEINVEVKSLLIRIRQLIRNKVLTEQQRLEMRQKSANKKEECIPQSS